MAGRGSLAGLMAYGNANEIVVDMAREVLPVVKRTPVLAGRQRHRSVPDARPLPARRSATLGFSGVQNFPTVGLFDGVIRAQLEETGMGYALEVELIRARADARPAHHALRVLARTTRRDMAQGRRRHRRVPPGTHHRRRHRRRTLR